MLNLQLDALIQAALLEDLGQGDVTTDCLPLHAAQCAAAIRNREACVVSGLPVALRVFHHVDPAIQVSLAAQPGEHLPPGATLAVIEGPVASVLKAERTALNFLQHLCGIATTTQAFVAAIAGTQARMTDTRKTTPGLRLLEKQAVQDGGGFPHRFNLGSAAMLKDNHLQAIGTLEGAVKALRAKASHTTKIEVEVESLDDVRAALRAGVDIILLDNMDIETLREAVALIGSQAITEASGGIRLETARPIAETGVQYLSTSQITLGAPAIDIGLDFLSHTNFCFK